MYEHDVMLIKLFQEQAGKTFMFFLLYFNYSCRNKL